MSASAAPHSSTAPPMSVNDAVNAVADRLENIRHRVTQLAERVDGSSAPPSEVTPAPAEGISGRLNDMGTVLGMIDASVERLEVQLLG